MFTSGGHFLRREQAMPVRATALSILVICSFVGGLATAQTPPHGQQLEMFCLC
jgi:hypothetical protein